MKKYEVSVVFRWISGFAIDAENEDEAREKAFEEANIYLSESHQYADDIEIVDVYSEEDN